MIPKVIHYCWFGHGAYPAIVRKCIESWERQCPDYELKLWNEDNYDVRKNVYVREAYDNKKWAFVSDYARLDVVLNEGGIYLDTDVELIRSLDGLLGESCFLAGDGSGINTGLGFGAEKGSPVVARMLREYDGRHFVVNGRMDLEPCTVCNTRPFLEYGYDIDAREVQRMMGATLLPPQYFSPIEGAYSELRVTEETYGIHWSARLWESGLTRVKSEVRMRLGADMVSRIKHLIKPKRRDGDNE